VPVVAGRVRPRLRRQATLFFCSRADHPSLLYSKIFLSDLLRRFFFFIAPRGQPRFIWPSLRADLPRPLFRSASCPRQHATRDLEVMQLRRPDYRPNNIPSREASFSPPFLCELFQRPTASDERVRKEEVCPHLQSYCGTRVLSVGGGFAFIFQTRLVS